MRDAHGGVSRIDRLPAWAGGTERVDTDVLGLEFHLHLVGLGQYRHRDGRRMDAALLLGLRHPLYAMYPALILHLAEYFVAIDQRDDFLEPADRRFAHRSDIDAPALGLGVARVHAK